MEKLKIIRDHIINRIEDCNKVIRRLNTISTDNWQQDKIDNFMDWYQDYVLILEVSLDKDIQSYEQLLRKFEELIDEDNDDDNPYLSAYKRLKNFDKELDLSEKRKLRN